MTIPGKSKHTQDLKRRLDTLASERKSFVLIGEPGVGKSSIAESIGKSDTSCTVVDVSILTEYELGTRLSEIKDGTVIVEGLDQSSFRIQSVLCTYILQRTDSLRFIITLRETLDELIEKRKLTEDTHAGLLQFETVEVLPLRCRQEDIPHLIRQFAPDLAIDINSIDVLIKHTWRENIRELKAVIDRCAESSVDGMFVLPSDLVEQKGEIAKAVSDILASTDNSLDESLDVMEQSILTRALSKFGFNTAKAAQFLGMSEHSLKDKTKGLAFAKSSSH